ncbi:DNA-directed RNA polymerase II subunit RPB7 [Gossypium arboreum]|uniref:DNA-directed RNA polymerase subunit n=1 Tax=Gossypium arboreum TaxID=29729 RepID=A0A0B0MPI2_GOSAR|nr:DNA-directed RNA polymerase II subunit RPB7 [Gossypium arboreum]
MQLHPRHFGRNLRENIVSKLMKDVEGTRSGRHGFVVAITGIENVGKGLIRDGAGFVTFPVKYQCIVFRPFKGEILEAVVTKMGFFAEAGPVQIFVSNHLTPDDMEFQSGDLPNYTTSGGSFCIGTIKDDFLGSKQEDSDSSSNKAKSHKKSDKSGKKEGNVDDADYQGATTTTTAASSDAGVAAAVAVGATTAHASAVE